MKRKLACNLFCASVLLLAPVASAQGPFVYVNGGGVGVLGSLVGANGALTAMPGSPFIIGGNPGGSGRGIAVSSLRNTLYVSSDNISPKISAFSINPVTGFLTPIAGSPFDTGTGIVGAPLLAIAPNDQFLFAVDAGVIATFGIAADGGLIRLAQITSTLGSVTSLKTSPNGRFLFVTEGFSFGIGVFSIAPDGAVARVSHFPLVSPFDCDNGALEINCGGNLLFASSTCGEILVLNIAANGALTPVAGSPFDSGHLGLDNMLLNSSGNLLIVTDIRFARISVLGVTPTGSVSSVPISSINITNPHDEDSRPVDLALNAAETLLYIASANTTIFVFNVASGGLLTPVPGSPFPGGSGYGAGITAYPGRSCGTVFDTCIQGDSNGAILKINSTTSEYQLSDCNGVITAGSGTLTRRGCLITLQDNASDRRVLARMETCQNKATASIQLLSLARAFTIIDQNTLNNNCSCR